ncbi:MAG TPA: 7TM domain-containing protein [Candidatus Saccharimonadales bacterium]|nr:7TM domain-containing protein [Candidatus Saccharimonadales bacterium]
MKKCILLLIICFAFFGAPASALAQNSAPTNSQTAKASQSAQQEKQEIVNITQNINQITNPEQDGQRNTVLTKLVKQRNVETLTPVNFAPYAIQYAIRAGVPTNTIDLILLIPLLATIVVAFRYIVGLSGIGLLVPIALSITLLATGVTPGFIMLATIIVASLVSKFFLKRLPVMQMPKVALSMLMVSLFLLASLTVSSIFGIIDVRSLSIFPILLFILLSDRIVSLFLERDFIETVQTTVITLFLAILGFLLLTWQQLRLFTLIYPESILLLIPINIMIGRYFGLRMTEYIKFQPILKHGSK